MFAFYVIAWTIIIGSIAVYLLHIFLQRTDLLITYGVKIFAFALFLCILRFFLPLELSRYQYKIELPIILPEPIRQFHILGQEFSIFQILSCIYLSIVLYKTIQFIKEIHHIKESFWTNSLPSERGSRILYDIDPNCYIPVRSTFLVNTPLISGYFRPTIYLPEYELSDKDLYNVIIHEYIHWRYHHIKVKCIVHLFSIFLWWNPFAKQLDKDVSHLFELICDDIVFQKHDSQTQLSYLATILHCLNYASKSPRIYYANSYFMGLVETETQTLTKQRFEYQLSKEKYSQKPFYVFLSYSLIVFVFLASYFLIMQPSFSAQTDEGYVISNPDNAYILELPKGGYEFHFQGNIIPVSSEEIKSGLYDMYEIIPYKNYMDIK